MPTGTHWDQTIYTQLCHPERRQTYPDLEKRTTEQKPGGREEKQQRKQNTDKQEGDLNNPSLKQRANPNYSKTAYTPWSMTQSGLVVFFILTLSSWDIL